MLFVTNTRYNFFAVESGIKLNSTVLQASGCVLHPDKETMYRFVADRLHLDKDEIAGLELTLKASQLPPAGAGGL